jgi:CRP-like cAMP-binding protein
MLVPCKSMDNNSFRSVCSDDRERRRTASAPGVVRDPVLQRALYAAAAPVKKAAPGPLRRAASSALLSEDHGDRSALSRQHLLARLHLNHGLSDEQILGQLRKVRWFRTLSMPQLLVLFGRARHIFFPRYAVILRESNVGSSFYLLLQGRVRCTSSLRGTANLGVLGAGSGFGEAALVTTVRREATVTALEDCYLLQLRAADVADLPIVPPEVQSKQLKTKVGADILAAARPRRSSMDYEGDDATVLKATLIAPKWERLVRALLGAEDRKDHDRWRVDAESSLTEGGLSRADSFTHAPAAAADSGVSAGGVGPPVPPAHPSNRRRSTLRGSGKVTLARRPTVCTALGQEAERMGMTPAGDVPSVQSFVAEVEAQSSG